MDVSIVVVAWNVRNLLEQCIRSVYEQTREVQFEIIYVDNGSEDGSVEMVKKEFPDVRIIENKTNLGFIKASNQGIRVSTGRYVLLLNSDTIILDNAIMKTIHFADEHPEAAVVGCKVLNPDGSLQRSAFQFYSTLNMMFLATGLYKIFCGSSLLGRKSYMSWNFDSVREVDVIAGCFSLVRMSAIEKVGLMDEIFFVYGDDADWCYRFVKAGWKVLFTPSAQIIHYGGQTTKKAANKFSYQLFGSIVIMVRKHYSYVTFFICRVLTALFFLMRVPYWALVGVALKNERERAFGTTSVYLLGCYYALTDWTKLLINKENREEVRDKFNS